jgi:DNA-binding PadR family transcriptional regulator
MGTRRLSDETAAVLTLFLSDPDRPRYGREVVAETKLKSGSLYPILRRLEAHRVLESEWENPDAAFAEGRRPRRMYRLREEGTLAEGLLSEWRRARPRSRSPIGREQPA